MKRYKKGDDFYKGSIILNGKRIFNPSASEIIEAGYVEYEEPTIERTLEDAKREKINAINLYDSSDNVNQFFLNGSPLWLTKEERSSLINSANAKAITLKGDDISYEIWLAGDNPIKITSNSAQVIEMVSMVEAYAFDCRNVTQEHKSNVQAATTIEDADAYDNEVNYPNKLKLTL